MHDVRRRTRLLWALLAVAAGAVWVGASRHGAARAAASVAAVDLAVVRAQLADLATAGGAEPSTTTAGGAGTDPELNRRVREAAAGAAIGGQLSSIEPREPRQVEGSDRAEALLFLHFDRVTVRGVVGFLQRLSTSSPNVRPAGIELTTADIAPGSQSPAGEMWIADLTLSYEVLLSPKGERATPQ